MYKTWHQNEKKNTLPFKTTALLKLLTALSVFTFSNVDFEKNILPKQPQPLLFRLVPLTHIVTEVLVLYQDQMDIPPAGLSRVTL
jgi:hypothetical protein